MNHSSSPLPDHGDPDAAVSVGFERSREVQEPQAIKGNVRAATLANRSPMSSSDSSAIQRPSSRNKLLVWAGVACAVAVLTVVTFLSVSNHRAAMLIQSLRDRGEPVCAADIEFDEGIPPSDLHERALRFGAVESKSVYVSPDAEDVDEELVQLEAWPEGRAALPAIREYMECIRLDPPEPETRQMRVGKRSSKGSAIFAMPHINGPHDWPELVRLCMDPVRLDLVTDCERAGIRAMESLNDPCVSVSLDMCDVPRETGEQILRAWEPSNGRPALADLLALMNGARILTFTIPGLLLRGDTDSAMTRVEAIFHAAESVRGLPWEFGQRCWIRLVSLGLDGCRMILASHAESVDWSPVLRQLDGFDPRANFERALVGSRALGIEIFEAARSGRLDPESDLARMCGKMHAMDLTGGVDLSFYLDVMQEGIDLTQKDVWGPTRGKRDWQYSKGEFPLWAQLSWGLLPWLDGLRFRTLEIQGDIALARVAIAASTKGAEVGETMAASTPDLFDGHAMRSRRDGQVLTLWSVGIDRVDDGASSEEVWTDEFHINKHMFRHSWGAGSEMYREDIVWRVRVR